MKTILIITLAAVVGGAILWAAPYRLSAADTTLNGQPNLYYTCPMHPSAKSEKPGDSPLCGMHLVPVYAKPSGDGTNAPPAVTNTNAPSITGPGCCGFGGCR